MLNFNDYENRIKSFILFSTQRFREENGECNSLGIYCCSWAGWIATCFNVSRTLESTEYSCPDFEYFRYDVLELNQWQEEYVTGEPRYKLNGAIIDYGKRQGDEVLNQFVFEFLSPIISKVKSSVGEPVLLQLLDSTYVKVF